MPRPAAAAQAGCPAPAMIAARAKSAGFKCIPHRAAAAVKIFGKITVGAKPAARGIRLPFANRAANAAEIRFIFFRFKYFENFFSLGSFLKRRDYPAESNYF